MKHLLLKVIILFFITVLCFQNSNGADECDCPDNSSMDSILIAHRKAIWDSIFDSTSAIDTLWVEGVSRMTEKNCKLKTGPSEQAKTSGLTSNDSCTGQCLII